MDQVYFTWILPDQFYYKDKKEKHNIKATDFQNWAFINYYFHLKLLTVDTVRCITTMHKDDYHQPANKD